MRKRDKIYFWRKTETKALPWQKRQILPLALSHRRSLSLYHTTNARKRWIEVVKASILRQLWYNFERGSELVKLARWRELILTHSETQHVSSSHVMTARGSGVRLDQWEARLAQHCALIGREPCVTRGDRCGRVLAGIPVARRALDSLEWSPITLTASQLHTIVRNWFSVAKNNCFATVHKLSQLQRTAM